ncbi:type IV pilus modification protein PilV [compost metagenome]
MNSKLHRRHVRPTRTSHPGKTQQGIVLLEALIALLIFSVGVLGLVGLQATSVKQAAAAEYRATAVLQANDLISRMWVGDRSDAALKAQFASTGNGYKTWKSDWANALPGADVVSAPEVTITSKDKGSAATLGTNSAVITIHWQAPGDDPRKYTVVAQFDQPQK